MAFFSKKKPPESGDPNNTSNGETEFKPQPEKAQKWFEHAKTAAMSANFDYALSCYANGLKLDPELMSAHEAMFDAGVRYTNQGGKPASGKEIRKLEESHPIAKFIVAEFAWMKSIMDANLAVKALDASIKADQFEWGNSVSTRIIRLITQSKAKKPGKSTWLNLMQLFREVHAYDEAMFAGNQALNLDPTDSTLDHDLKNISAQRTMDQGGYEEAGGEEGGFRTMVKDMDRQRELEEGDRMTVSRSAQDRKLAVSERDYNQAPDVPDYINIYASNLKKMGTPEGIQRAHEVYTKGYEDTAEYRFRMYAGDIEIGLARQKELELREKLTQNAENGALQKEYEQAREDRLTLEASEFNERILKYPTDRLIRFRQGEILLELGDHENAMEHFQSAKDEPKLRVRASYRLGNCFALMHWHNEAIEELKEALEALDVGDKKRELDIRYDLMLSLIEHARDESDSDLAREARDICSNIARKNIGYRDIRVKRKEVETLIKELSSGSSS